MKRITKDKYESIMYGAPNLITQIYATHFYCGFGDFNDINSQKHKTLMELNEEIHDMYIFIRTHLTHNTTLKTLAPILILKYDKNS